MSISTPSTMYENQLRSLGEENDRSDASTIFAIYSALGPFIEGLTSRRQKSWTSRALREAIQKIWQEPRMPSGKVKKLGHNKPFDYPWSPKARDLYFAKASDPEVVLTNRLVLEHVVPLNIFAGEMVNLVAGGCTEDEFYLALVKAHEGTSFTIITKEEHRKISNVGFGASIVKGSSNVWERYVQGCGLRKDDFMSITEDPRYA